MGSDSAVVTFVGLAMRDLRSCRSRPWRKRKELFGAACALRPRNRFGANDVRLSAS